MKLSTWIYNYRKEHALSMQSMADLCGLSKQYISVLEKGVNPNTKKEFIPSIETIKKISDATNTDLTDLINLLGNDQEILINSVTPFPKFETNKTVLSDQERKLITFFRKLNSVGKEKACDAVRDLTEIARYTEPDEKEKTGT